MNKLESELLAALLLVAPREVPAMRVFRRNVAFIQIKDPEHGKDRKMRFGVKRQCDTYALVAGGLHLELELKSATGRLTPEQREWRSFCATWRIPYRLLFPTPGETPAETVMRWCVEIRELLTSLGIDPYARAAHGPPGLA